MSNTISKKVLSAMKLKGKPKCPACGKPLTFVYEGSEGYSSMKCKRCNRESLVNTGTLEVKLIDRAG